MNITRKLAIAGAGVLSIVGVGGGVALAQSPPASTVSPPAATSAPAPAQATTPDTATAPEAPDAAGTTAEKPSTEAEKPGVEEPGDANLPGGGHADPVGQNVDHQFEGVE